MINNKLNKKDQQSKEEKKIHDHEHTQWNRRSFMITIPMPIYALLLNTNKMI